MISGELETELRSYEMAGRETTNCEKGSSGKTCIPLTTPLHILSSFSRQLEDDPNQEEECRLGDGKRDGSVPQPFYRLGKTYENDRGNKIPLDGRVIGKQIHIHPEEAREKR